MNRRGSAPASHAARHDAQREAPGAHPRRGPPAPPEPRRLLYEVAFCTGLRANEIRELTVGHLDRSAEGLRLDAAWTKNRKAGFQPLPRRLVERLVLSAQGKALTEALLSVPSHPAREFYRDIDRVGIPRRIAGLGKADFHACRVAYTTLVVESGANMKEAQELLRHSTPTLTMEAYARARSESLGRVADSVGQMVLGAGQISAPTEPPLPAHLHSVEPGAAAAFSVGAK